MTTDLHHEGEPLVLQELRLGRRVGVGARLLTLSAMQRGNIVVSVQFSLQNYSPTYFLKGELREHLIMLPKID